MAKSLILASLLLSFAAQAEVFSGRNLKCKLMTGGGLDQHFSAAITVHETSAGPEVLDVMLHLPRPEKNVRPFSLILTPSVTPSGVLAVGHNLQLAISTNTPKLSAVLVDKDWLQVYDCAE